MRRMRSMERTVTEGDSASEAPPSRLLLRRHS